MDVPLSLRAMLTNRADDHLYSCHTIDAAIMTASWYELEDIASVIAPDAWRAYREVFDPVGVVFRHEYRSIIERFQATGKDNRLLFVETTDPDACEYKRACDESFQRMNVVERPSRLALTAAIVAKIDEARINEPNR